MCVSICTLMIPSYILQKQSSKTHWYSPMKKKPLSNKFMPCDKNRWANSHRVCCRSCYQIKIACIIRIELKVLPKLNRNKISVNISNSLGVTLNSVVGKSNLNQSSHKTRKIVGENQKMLKWSSMSTIITMMIMWLNVNVQKAIQENPKALKVNAIRHSY